MSLTEHKLAHQWCSSTHNGFWSTVFKSGLACFVLFFFNNFWIKGSLTKRSFWVFLKYYLHESGGK